MKKYISFALIALAFVFITASLTVHAQTNMVMIPLYNASNQQVNSTNVTLPAGWYYTQPGVTSSQVYYYGNGTYYDPSTGTYGGNVSNPSGMAGVNIGYSTTPITTPGVPNTGAGGDATMNWIILGVAGLIVATGAAYLVTRSSKREVTRVRS